MIPPFGSEKLWYAMRSVVGPPEAALEGGPPTARPAAPALPLGVEPPVLQARVTIASQTASAPTNRIAIPFAEPHSNGILPRRVAAWRRPKYTGSNGTILKPEERAP